MRELVLERIRNFWLGAESEELFDLSLAEMDNLTDEELLDVLVEMSAYPA